MRIVPESDRVFAAIPALKDELQVNVELAAPPDFIPELPGWEARCLYIGREGDVEFYHYDPYSQALAKIERGHAQDRGDVQEWLNRGLVDPARLRSFFAAIEGRLGRYPAIDPAAFRRALEEALSTPRQS